MKTHITFDFNWLRKMVVSESSFCDLEIKVNSSSHGRAELSLKLELFIELGFSGLERLLGH